MEYPTFSPLGKARVVMIAQDQHHGPGQEYGTRLGYLPLFPATVLTQTFHLHSPTFRTSP